jgi:predicted glycogen debranching enzyme
VTLFVSSNDWNFGLGDAMSNIEFGRSICGDLVIAQAKEWLVTNGIGGYASGTVAGLLTRRYHGLLIAALQPPLGRTLLAAKLDETVTYNASHYPLFANRWSGDIVDPLGFYHIERFHLDGTTPVWTYAFADARFIKRIWMQPGENTTYVSYYVERATSPLTFLAKALVNYRDYHGTTKGDGWNMQVERVKHGLQVTAFEGAIPFVILSKRAEVTPAHEWYQNFELSVEQYRGLGSLEDHLDVGEFKVTLAVGEAVTFVISTETEPELDGAPAFLKRQTYEQGLASLARQLPAQLCLAADQFIARRPTNADADGRTILAGYHWFGDWGRDTMISLPGLTLVTGRHEVARSILRTFAQYVDQGMLPNRFPDAGEVPEYNTVDATLWYFEAIRAYFTATHDEKLLAELFPVLAEIIDWHERGTRYQIHVDPSDGLLYAGEKGVQLTWMDAKVGDWVVTPRIGKPVEINALWYNALLSMADFARLLGKQPDRYMTLANRVQESFSKFWNEDRGFCYDVIDGPDGNDDALRPNQLFAVSLNHSPLEMDHQKAVVDISGRQLLTSHGLRSLAPGEPGYIGHYGGDARQRDGAYHQGTVWAWLIGPFVSAHLRVYKDPSTARSFLEPLIHHLSDHGLGSISEIFDGDPPFTPRGCFAQAWSVAEVLRVLADIQDEIFSYRGEKIE